MFFKNKDWDIIESPTQHTGTIPMTDEEVTQYKQFLLDKKNKNEKMQKDIETYRMTKGKIDSLKNTVQNLELLSESWADVDDLLTPAKNKMQELQTELAKLLNEAKQNYTQDEILSIIT